MAATSTSFGDGKVGARRRCDPGLPARSSCARHGLSHDPQLLRLQREVRALLQAFWAGPREHRTPRVALRPARQVHIAHALLGRQDVGGGHLVFARRRPQRLLAVPLQRLRQVRRLEGVHGPCRGADDALRHEQAHQGSRVAERLVRIFFYCV